MENKTFDNERTSVFMVACIMIFVIFLAVFGFSSLAKIRRDSSTAQEIQKAIALVIAQDTGVSLVSGANGSINWTEKNAARILNTVVGQLNGGKGGIPIPERKNCYFYMYLQTPYTVVTLPYRNKGEVGIDLSKVDREYMENRFSGNKFAQIGESVPSVLLRYQQSGEAITDPRTVVCLNVAIPLNTQY